MNKPITVAHQEFTTAIVQACNDSGLPAFIMANVLHEAEAAARDLAKKQLVADTAEWEKQQEKTEVVADE